KTGAGPNRVQRAFYLIDRSAESLERISLHVPISPHQRRETRDEATAGSALPGVQLSIVVAPQDVVESITVKIAGLRHMPVGTDLIVDGGIADEAATGLSVPFGEGAIVVAPQDVVESITVKIAGLRHMPAGTDLIVDGGNADEAATGLSVPF